MDDFGFSKDVDGFDMSFFWISIWRQLITYVKHGTEVLGLCKVLAASVSYGLFGGFERHLQ